MHTQMDPLRAALLAKARATATSETLTDPDMHKAVADYAAEHPADRVWIGMYPGPGVLKMCIRVTTKDSKRVDRYHGFPVVYD